MAGTQTIAQTRAEHARQIRVSRETARLLPIVAPVIFGGTLATILALSALAGAEPLPQRSRHNGAARRSYLRRGHFRSDRERARRRHVPRHGLHRRNGGDYGWAAAIIVGVVTQVLVEVIRRQPAVRVLFNTSVYALGAAAAGAVCAVIPDEGFGWLALEVGLAATASTRSFRSSPRWSAAGAKAFYLSFDAPLRRRSSLSPSWRPSLMLAVLWNRSPFLSAAIGPLAAIALYQRSVFRELAAIRLALTDPLTGPATIGTFTRGSIANSAKPRTRACRSASASSTSTTSRS